jgi:signal transduction histidine kinase
MEGHLILVVDDHDSARYAKARVLRRAGYEVIEAASGEETLRLAAEREPRLIVLDIQLPDIDGWTVCTRLKQDPETASILVLQVSATFASEQDTVRSLEGGADACLTEPLEGPVLVATVRALLRARRAEDALRDALEREQSARNAAESANRAKDEFLALLSHELRTPLGTILTWVTLLRDNQPEEDLVRRGLEAIDRNTRVQVKLIEELLDVSRIVTGKTSLDLDLVDLAATLEEALESVRAEAMAKSITLRVDSLKDEYFVLGDATRMQQVMWNLLSNAVKFTPRDGWVETRFDRVGSEIRIQVTDSGKGITPDVLPHIFERFLQADSSTTRGEGGLGLGLAIVRHMVELHGGQVEASSPGPNQGSTFTVRLPVPALRDVPPSRRLVSRQHPPVPDLPAQTPLQGSTVLVLDDERDAREAVAAVLESAGARVRLAGTVEEALETIDRDGDPDVIVSDIAMPVQDGFAFIRQVRQRGASAAPALALTAHAGQHESSRILEAGFHSYLAKPIEAAKLIAAVVGLTRMPR